MTTGRLALRRSSRARVPSCRTLVISGKASALGRRRRRQFEQHRPRLFGAGEMRHRCEARAVFRREPRRLGDRRHQRGLIDPLMRLRCRRAGWKSLRQMHQRISLEPGSGDAGHGIGQAGTLDRQRNAGAAGKPAHGRRHQRARAFEMREVKGDAALFQRVDQRQRHAAARHAEQARHAMGGDLFGQSRDVGHLHTREQVPDLFGGARANNPHRIRAEAAAMRGDQQVVVLLGIFAQGMVLHIRFAFQHIEAGGRRADPTARPPSSAASSATAPREVLRKIAPCFMRRIRDRQRSALGWHRQRCTWTVTNVAGRDKLLQ